MKSMLLLKDQSIKMKKIRKFIKSNFEDIQYILFLSYEEASTFILQKPKEFMVSFSRAVISFETVIIQHSYENSEVEEYPTLMNVTNKELFTLEELYAYLHSLHRIKYWNKLSNSNDCTFYDIMEFVKFSIQIFDKNDKIIYDKNMDLTSQRGVFGVREILNEIASIYKPKIIQDESSNSFQNLLKIDAINMRWDFVSEIDDECSLYGISLPYTKSFRFLYGKEILLIKSKVRSFYCYTMTYNPEAVEDYEIETIKQELPYSQYKNPTCPIRFQDVWVHQFEYYIEYICYLSYIYANLIIISEINDLGEVKNKYCSQTEFTIELIISNSSERYQELGCNTDNPLHLESFIKLLEERW